MVRSCTAHLGFGDSGLTVAGTGSQGNMPRHPCANMRGSCISVHSTELRDEGLADSDKLACTRAGRPCQAGQDTYCVHVAELLTRYHQVPSHQQAGHDTHQLGRRSAGIACSSVTAGLACLCRLELLWDCGSVQLPLCEVSWHVRQRGQLPGACWCKPPGQHLAGCVCRSSWLLGHGCSVCVDCCGLA